MLYPYITLSDETAISHSHIIEENSLQMVEVHFERPTEDGFDMARVQLPSYNWIIKEGFSDSEIQFFEQFLVNNAHLIYRFAQNGGMCCA